MDYTYAMKRRWKITIGVVTLLAAALLGTFFAARAGLFHVETVEKEDVANSNPEDLLADDKLEDKKPEFIPTLVDSRPFGPADNPWQINASDAVIRLDVPDIRSDAPEALHKLYPDYAAGAKALSEAGFELLPSVNVIGGKAKQFDDGLYAALDLYMVQNSRSGVRDIELCVRQVLTELNPAYEPYAWLWASLEIGGFVSADEYSRRPRGADRFVSEFLANDQQSKPVGFYTWSENLQRAFRFLRYLQQPFNTAEGTPAVLARALNKNSAAREHYLHMLEFYSRLTNPFHALALTDLHEGKTLDAIAAELGRPDATVHFLPYSTSQETVLFESLYPQGVPPDAELMRDLITAIRDGTIDLKPDENSGWYEYQVHALETLVMPEVARENEKLLLTKKYKLRLLEAFKAMVTKTRETHIRSLPLAEGAAAPPSEGLKPRLRVEPNPTYFLRMARSYGFLQTFLRGSMGDAALNSVIGHRADGLRDMPLGDELESMRMLFYGLYFVSCEDIGLKPEILTDELGYETHYVRALAAKWLEDWHTDPDLAVDTRVAVPVYNMPGGYTRFWCTIGVRPIKLTASYATQPSWRPWPEDGEKPGAWDTVPRHQLLEGNWVILADEFAEVQVRGAPAITRKELRDICNNHNTKEAIIKALQR